MLSIVIALICYFTPLLFLGYGVFLLLENRKLKYPNISKKGLTYIGICFGWLFICGLIPFFYQIAYNFSTYPVEGVYLSDAGDSVLIDNENIVIKYIIESRKDETGKYYEFETPEESYLTKITHFYMYPETRGFDAKLMIVHSNTKDIVEDPVDRMYDKIKENKETTEVLWYKSNTEGFFLTKYKYSDFMNPISFFKRIN